MQKWKSLFQKLRFEGLTSLEPVKSHTTVLRYFKLPMCLSHSKEGFIVFPVIYMSTVPLKFAAYPKVAGNPFQRDNFLLGTKILST